MKYLIASWAFSLGFVSLVLYFGIPEPWYPVDTAMLFMGWALGLALTNTFAYRRKQIKRNFLREVEEYKKLWQKNRNHGW